MGIDYRATAPKVTADSLSAVTLLAQQLVDEQAKIKKLETDLAAAKLREKQLSEFDLPQAMDQATLAEFKTTTGKQITIADVCSGSPAKDNFDLSLEWLRARHQDGIIKRAITLNIRLPKGNDKLGDKIVKYLQRLKTLQSLNVAPTDKPELNFQTFGAWARDHQKNHKENHLNGGAEYELHINRHSHDSPEESCEYCACPFCHEEDLKLLGIYVGRKSVVKDLPR